MLVVQTYDKKLTSSYSVSDHKFEMTIPTWQLFKMAEFPIHVHYIQDFGSPGFLYQCLITGIVCTVQTRAKYTNIWV